MSRVLRGSAPLIQAAFLSGEDPEGVGTVGVTVTDLRGNVVAVGEALEPAGEPVYTFTVPASATGDVALLAAAWEAADGRTVTTSVEVVGGRYAGIREVRSLKHLSDRDRFPLADLEAAMSAAEDKFQEVTGVAWQPRLHVAESHPVDAWRGIQVIDTGKLYVRRVLWARADGEEIDVSGWQVTAGGLVIADVAPTGFFLAVAVEHGKDAVPVDLRRAFLTYVRALLLDDAASAIPERATAVTTELGTFRINQAGFGAPTGYPEVDAVLALYDEGGPSVA